jgi:hypothetical protein
MATARPNPSSSVVHEQARKDLERTWKEARAEVAASSSVLQCGGGEYNQVSIQVWGRSGVEGHPTLLSQSDWEEF